ncbi:MAG: tetratricopeptide repeat protein [Rhodospirillales bacterium]|nr:tetratricopeptide repeat protein [Rhodospirillales bacterium]
MLIAAAVVVVAAAGGWKAWQAWQTRQRNAVATLFLVAGQAADSPDAATRQKAVPELRQVIARGDEGYKTLARLRLAAVLAGTDPKEALTLWNQVAGDAAADPLLRDTASLAWALHVVDTGDAGIVGARLAALARPENPLHALAEEAQALLDLRLGKLADAKAKLKALMDDTTAPPGVRGRASGLLTQLGGS